MDIDTLKLSTIAQLSILEDIDVKNLPQLTANALYQSKTKLMQIIILINCIQSVRNSHPAAAFKMQLYLEGIT